MYDANSLKVHLHIRYNNIQDFCLKHNVHFGQFEIFGFEYKNMCYAIYIDHKLKQIT